MQAGQLVLVQTDPASQFVDAIAQNAMAELTMTQVPAGQSPVIGYVDGGVSAGKSCRSRLKALGLVAVESLDWTVWFWGNATFSDADPRNERFLGFVNLPASAAKRPANASGLYHYFQGGLDLPIVDLAGQGQLYIGLQPTSAGKSAGEAGSVSLILTLEPTLGF